MPVFIVLFPFSRSSRKTFDTSDTSKEFGPVRIEFGKVQSKVSLKYDSWHKDVLSKFGNMLGNEMQDFHGNVSKVGVVTLKVFNYLVSAFEIHLCALLVHWIKTIGRKIYRYPVI